MSNIAHVLVGNAKFTKGYADVLTKGIDAKLAARKPKGNAITGASIDTNHPAFVYGHLSLYFARLPEILGVPAPEGIRAPEHWEPLFKAGAPCHDDPEGKIYPTWDAVLAQFNKGSDLALGVLAQATESTFYSETTDPSRKERFPYVGNLVAFLVMGHPMMHLGQISTWRRCYGLPSALG